MLRIDVADISIDTEWICPVGEPCKPLHMTAHASVEVDYGTSRLNGTTRITTEEWEMLEPIIERIRDRVRADIHDALFDVTVDAYR